MKAWTFFFSLWEAGKALVVLPALVSLPCPCILWLQCSSFFCLHFLHVPSLLLLQWRWRPLWAGKSRVFFQQVFHRASRVFFSLCPCCCRALECCEDSLPRHTPLRIISIPRKLVSKRYQFILSLCPSVLAASPKTLSLLLPDRKALDAVEIAAVAVWYGLDSSFTLLQKHFTFSNEMWFLGREMHKLQLQQHCAWCVLLCWFRKFINIRSSAAWVKHTVLTCCFYKELWEGFFF